MKYEIRFSDYSSLARVYIVTDSVVYDADYEIADFFEISVDEYRERIKKAMNLKEDFLFGGLSIAFNDPLKRDENYYIEKFKEEFLKELTTASLREEWLIRW